MALKKALGNPPDPFLWTLKIFAVRVESVSEHGSRSAKDVNCVFYLTMNVTDSQLASRLRSVRVKKRKENVPPNVEEERGVEGR